MPLILAIEPDRRQAARVAALTRGALDAELVVADSTESATAALKGREPDLILTSLLMSPKEEAGLRAFDRAGVPVPTLVIPVLASTSPGRSRNGLLKRLSWSRASDEAADVHGCDPAVFASQIAEYLATSARDAEFASSMRDRVDRRIPVRSEEQSAAAPAVSDTATTVDDSMWASDEAPQEFGRDAVAPTPNQAEPDAVEGVAAGTGTFQAADSSWAVLQHSSDEEQVVEEGVPEWTAPAVEEETAAPDEPAALFASQTGSTDVLTRLDEPDAERIVDEPETRQYFHQTLAEEEPATTPVVVEEDERTTFEPAHAARATTPDFAWDEIALEDEDDQTIELSSETIDLQAFVHELEASADGEQPAADVAQPEAIRVDEDEIDLDSTSVPVGRAATAHASPPSGRETSAARAMHAAAPVAPDMAGVVADFVEALEDEPEATALDGADSDLWMPLPPGAGGYWPRLDSKCSHPRQTEDEWGFFDPDQCGMSAVIAKLDQMTR